MGQQTYSYFPLCAQLSVQTAISASPIYELSLLQTVARLGEVAMVRMRTASFGDIYILIASDLQNMYRIRSYSSTMAKASFTYNDRFSCVREDLPPRNANGSYFCFMIALLPSCGAVCFIIPAQNLSETSVNMDMMLVSFGYVSLAAFFNVPFRLIKAVSCVAPQESLESSTRLRADLFLFANTLYAASNISTSGCAFQLKFGIHAAIYSQQ